MKSSIELIAEFITPFEDKLTFVFIGDNISHDTLSLFSKAINKSRKSLPGKLDKVEFISVNTSDLFRGKYQTVFTNNICIQYFDELMSNNIIAYLTNKLDDQMEGMLIDKHLLQLPQEKYIFDISSTPDDDLADLCYNMDLKNGSYNYIILENYLAVWILQQDELVSLF